MASVVDKVSNGVRVTTLRQNAVNMEVLRTFGHLDLAPFYVETEERPVRSAKELEEGGCLATLVPAGSLRGAIASAELAFTISEAGGEGRLGVSQVKLLRLASALPVASLFGLFETFLEFFSNSF